MKYKKQHKKEFNQSNDLTFEYPLLRAYFFADASDLNPDFKKRSLILPVLRRDCAPTEYPGFLPWYTTAVAFFGLALIERIDRLIVHFNDKRVFKPYVFCL